MAITPAPVAGPSSARDPVLEQLAETNTFDGDWDALRSRFREALIVSIPLFQARGPRRAYDYQSSIKEEQPSLLDSTTTPPPSDAVPPSDSLLLSPDRPTSSLEANGTPSGLSDSLTSGASLGSDEEFKASTIGGLIIPPFPPLDPDRRKNGSPLQNAAMRNFAGGPISVSRQGALGGALGSTNIVIDVKVNGHGRMDDDWDEEIAIGGKKLPEWMGEPEGDREVERVTKLLDELDDPPFTIQRLAELLLSPTSSYSSIGKFLRAIEKSLLVTTPWEPPSYDPPPPSLLPGVGTTSIFPSSSTSSSSPARSSISLEDEESMMPPGASTPMFSPIPFLPQNGAMDIDAVGGDAAEGAGPSHGLEDGLMSPLMLGDSSPNPAGNSSFQFAPAPQPSGQGRSPTPEPEASEVASSSSTGSAVTPGLRTAALPLQPSDPGHQSYLGRVDELDTGPVPSQSTAQADAGVDADGSSAATSGAGEGGNMVQHGMSDKPVPLSSTTVVKEEDRKIAPRPKSLEERFTASTGSGEEDMKAETGEPGTKE